MHRQVFKICSDDNIFWGSGTGLILLHVSVALSRAFEGLAGDAAPYAVMDNRQTLIFQLLKSQR
jgi:hypothetical protein